MHELMYEHLRLFACRELVVAAVIHFDDIGRQHPRYFDEYLTEAPNACDCARLGVYTPDAENSLFLYMGELYFFDKVVYLGFDVWCEIVFHMSRT